MLLKEYNACGGGGNETEDMSLTEALNVDTIEARLQNTSMSCTLAHGKKREIIDAYLALCRSNEELQMLKDEADNIVMYYEKHKKIILLELEHLSHNINSFSRGAKALLLDLLTRNEVQLEKGVQLVKLFDTDDSEVCPNFEDESDDYFSDEDYEDDNI